MTGFYAYLPMDYWLVVGLPLWKIWKVGWDDEIPMRSGLSSQADGSSNGNRMWGGSRQVCCFTTGLVLEAWALWTIRHQESHRASSSSRVSSIIRWSAICQTGSFWNSLRMHINANPYRFLPLPSGPDLHFPSRKVSSSKTQLPVCSNADLNRSSAHLFLMALSIAESRSHKLCDTSRCLTLFLCSATGRPASSRSGRKRAM